MKDTISVVARPGGKDVIIEAGLLARQAAGAVTVRLGETVVFSGVTCSQQPREGIDYFPLQVEYREKYYAAGRFPGGFFKREARPSEKETLTARLTDRPIRPLFPKSYRNDVQVNNMLLSADGTNDGDVLSIVAASAALTISEIPFMGPIGAVRVGRIAQNFIINPTHAEREESDLDLIYAGTREMMIMIEGSAREISEADLLAAMKFAHTECVKLIDAQIELRRKLGLPDKSVVETSEDSPILASARTLAVEKMTAALYNVSASERRQKKDQLREELKAVLLAQHPDMTEEQFREAFDQLEIEVVRSNVLEKGRRLDGRGCDDIRPLYAQVGVLPRAHGSAIFARGETQALGTATLGTKADVQELDAVAGGRDEKPFMLHYNFPPYSTGEVGRIGSTGRREIGHGALAERSLEQVMPKNYPYTVRVVSDIMSSNGSTSMASVCVGSLALMDAGIPIRKPVAGISIGLFSNSSKRTLVVDILGAEDHCGDMDFKVAGTREGITGFQVDLKVRGLPWDLVEEALLKARDARLKILDFMSTVIPAPRPELSPHAPRIHQIKIDPEKIGALIGPGGKTIRHITEISGAQIDIEDDGTVSIFSVSKEGMDTAIREVEMIVCEAEEGKIYDGVVTGIKDFGAFVEILPGKDGLVHISELSDRHVKRVEDVCKVGDRMWVKCIGVDERGRIKLSRRQAMKERDAQQ